MKRTTIYWILFFGVLVTISWLYSTLNVYNEPILHTARSNQYEPAQVGDLYLVKDSLGNIQRFFKVIETTKYGRAVHISEGKPSYRNNFLNEASIIKGIQRPIYFEYQLKKVSKEYLVNFEKGAKDFSIYRLIYPPEEIPISFQLFYSPLFLLIHVGLLFLLIWLADYIKNYLNSRRYKWILQGGIFLVLSTIVISAISLLQVQISYGFGNNSAMGMVLKYSFSIVLKSSRIALIALPFFFLFKFFKAKYLISYSFADQEFSKFLFLVIGGCLYLGTLLLGFYCLTNLLSPQTPFLKVEFDQFLQAIAAVVIGFSIIAIANFLYNLWNHVQHFKFKENLLAQSEQKVLSSQSALDTLQARVNPHFLYNALNSIASLAQTNPAKTEEMALALSDFYKHSTNRQEEHLSTLVLELNQLQSYLNIEKIRFGERLQYKLDIAENTLNIQIPRFLLQPLVTLLHGSTKKVKFS